MATLNSTQLIDRSIINGAKLVNLTPESPLFGRLMSWLENCSKQRSQYINVVSLLKPSGTGMTSLIPSESE